MAGAEEQIEAPELSATPITTNVASQENSVERTQTTPEYKKAMADLAASGNAIPDVAAQNGAATMAENEGAAQASEHQAEASQPFEDQAWRQEADHRAAMQAARDAYDADLSEAKSHASIHDFFHDANGERKTGRMVLTAISGLFGAASGNPAIIKGIADTINGAIDRDFNKQKQEYAQRLDIARQRGEDMNRLEEQFQRQMARLQMRRGMAKERAAEEANAISSRSKNPAALAAAAEWQQKATQDNAEARARYALGAATKVRSGGTVSTHTAVQNPDDTQRRVNTQLTDVANAHKQLDAVGELSPAAAEATLRIMKEEPTRWDSLLHKDQPKYLDGLSAAEKAQVQAATSYLGARATKGPDGKANAENLAALLYQTVPIAGQDTPETAARKRANRIAHMTGMADQVPNQVAPKWRAIIDRLKQQKADSGISPGSKTDDGMEWAPGSPM